MNSKNKVGIKEIYKDLWWNEIQRDPYGSEKEFLEKIWGDFYNLEAGLVFECFKPTNPKELFPFELREYINEDTYKNVRYFLNGVKMDYAVCFLNLEQFLIKSNPTDLDLKQTHFYINSRVKQLKDVYAELREINKKKISEKNEYYKVLERQLKILEDLPKITNK